MSEKSSKQHSSLRKTFAYRTKKRFWVEPDCALITKKLIMVTIIYEFKEKRMSTRVPQRKEKTMTYLIERIGGVILKVLVI